MSSVSFRATAQIVIARTPGDVLGAFIDPKQMRRFWLHRSDSGLREGGSYRWMISQAPSSYDLDVRVVLLRRERELIVEWGEGIEHRRVRWLAEPLDAGSTSLAMEVAGSQPNKADAHRVALEETAGLNQLAVRAKAWLEHGVAMND